MSQAPSYVPIGKKHAGCWSRMSLLSCEPAQSKCTWTCQRKFTRKIPYALTATPISREPVQSKCTLHFTRAILCGNLQGCQTLIPRRPFCASLCSRNAHGHVIRAIWCENLQKKWRAPGPRHLFCASLRSRTAHGHVTRAILCEKLQETCRTLIPRPLFRASLRSRNAHVHVRRSISCGNLQGKFRMLWPRHPFRASLCSRNAHYISQEPFCVDIYRENAQTLIPRPFCVSVGSRHAHGHFTAAIFCGDLRGIRWYHLEWTPGRDAYRRTTLQCRHTVWESYGVALVLVAGFPMAAKKKWMGIGDQNISVFLQLPSLLTLVCPATRFPWVCNVFTTGSVAMFPWG